VFHIDVAKVDQDVAYANMLQVFQRYVASVCSKCFICFICCKRCDLDVAYVSYI
jgi:hypothetical protein